MRLLPMIAASLFALACLGLALAGDGPTAPIAGTVANVDRIDRWDWLDDLVATIEEMNRRGGFGLHEDKPRRPVPRAVAQRGTVLGSAPRD